MYPLGFAVDKETNRIDVAVFSDVFWKHPFIVAYDDTGALGCAMLTPEALAPVEFVQELMCPNCGRVCKGVTASVGVRDAPDPGDATVCAGCAWMLTFGDDLSLRVPTAEQFVNLLSMKDMVDSVMSASAEKVFEAMADKIGVEAPWKAEPNVDEATE